MSNQEDVIVVEHYGVAEFLKVLQPLLKSGYSLDFESNEHYPQSYGAFYSCTVVKDKQVEQPAEEVKEKKAGRPAKAS